MALNGGTWESNSFALVFHFSISLLIFFMCWREYTQIFWSHSEWSDHIVSNGNWNEATAGHENIRWTSQWIKKMSEKMHKISNVAQQRKKTIWKETITKMLLSYPPSPQLRDVNDDMIGRCSVLATIRLESCAFHKSVATSSGTCGQTKSNPIQWARCGEFRTQKTQN